MKGYPKCKSCESKMTIYDGNAWYTCPKCGNAVRDNGDGTWTWQGEIFGNGRKKDKYPVSDFELADFCRGGELTED